MSDDVDLCPICGRPAKRNGDLTCTTRGCPNAAPEPEATPRPDGRDVRHPTPNRPASTA